MTNDKIEEYLHGKCHLVALCAAELTECDVKAIWDLEPLNDELEIGPTALVHMYCVFPDGNVFDIRGVSAPDHIEWEIEEGEFGPVGESDEVEHKAEQIRSLIHEGILCDFEEGEKEMLASLVQSILPATNIALRL